MCNNIQDALATIRNMIAETEFEAEFVSMRVNTVPNGDIIVVTETAVPNWTRSDTNDDPDNGVLRRLRPGEFVLVEVYDKSARKWIPEGEADWLRKG